MSDYKSVLTRDSYSFFLNNSNNPIMSLTKNLWESQFFKIKMATLQVNVSDFKLDKIELLKKILKQITVFADKRKYKIIQLEIDIKWIYWFFIFEENKFQLVDTKLSCITLIKKDEVIDFQPKIGTIEIASPKMEKELLEISEDAFISNPIYLSRFKNQRYYTKNDCKKYYAAWITNHIVDKETIFAVAKNKNELMGFMIYKKTGIFKNKPLYKGLIVAVKEKYRGNKIHFSLMPYIYKKIPEKQFYIDSTTQLSNTPTIKNYINSKKTFESVKMIYYRKGMEEEKNSITKDNVRTG